MSSLPCRTLPPSRGIPSFPKRHSQFVFDTFNERNATEYEMWKRGINPRTGRNIQIGGKTHTQIGSTCFTVWVYGTGGLRTGLRTGTPFRLLEGIDQNKYEKETKSLMSQHQREVEAVQAYNQERQVVIEQIGRLRWNETVTFDQTEYGIPEVHQSIHRKDDCLGCMDVKQTWEADVGRERCFDVTSVWATFVRFECKRCGYQIVVRQ